MKILTIENMIKKTIKDPYSFNHYPYYEKAVCNQFFFAIDGPSCDYLSQDKVIICRIVPKIFWEKKHQFFTQEINLHEFLGSDSQDLNGTGSWFLPNLSRNPIQCANELVEKGFIWDKSLQLAVSKYPSDDVECWNSQNFNVIPNSNFATSIDKPITPELELQIFESRLKVQELGLTKALLGFSNLVRTPPITKETIILGFLKKHNVPYDAAIDDSNRMAIPDLVCWLDKSQILKHYIEHIPKNTIDNYGRTLLHIAQSYNSKKSEAILLANGFSNTLKSKI